jgi:hypothetical protein
MRRVLCVMMLVAGCSKKASTTPVTATDTGEPVITEQTLLGWGLQGHPEASKPSTKIFLEVTDQHGNTKSLPVGEAAGACTPKPGNGTDIVIALACDQVMPGVELRAVYRGRDIIVLSRRLDEATDPTDELAFQEVTRVTVPTGSKVKAAP